MPRQTLRLVLAAAFLALPARAPAQEHHHAHDAGEQLGAVHFPTSCRGVDAEFTRAVALLHSFGYEESRRAFETVAAKDPACGMASWGIAMTWYHPIWAPPTPRSWPRAGRGAEGARARRQDGSRARLHRGDRHVLPRLGAPGPQHAGERIQGGDGGALAEIPDDHEATIFYALAILRTAPPKRPDLRRTEARRDPERPAPARAAASGHRALHDPRVRLSGARGGSAPGGPRLREDRALLAARAPYAVAHLHAARPLAGVDRLEPRVGRSRPPARRAPAPGRELLRRAPRSRLSRVRVPPDRRHGEGAPGARGSRDGEDVRRAELRGRVCARGDSGALDARAAGLEGRGRARACARGDALGELALRSRDHRTSRGARRRAERAARSGPRRRSRPREDRPAREVARARTLRLGGQVESMRLAAAAWVAYADGKGRGRGDRAIGRGARGEDRQESRDARAPISRARAVRRPAPRDGPSRGSARRIRGLAARGAESLQQSPRRGAARRSAGERGARPRALRAARRAVRAGSPRPELGQARKFLAGPPAAGGD